MMKTVKAKKSKTEICCMVQLSVISKHNKMLFPECLALGAVHWNYFNLSPASNSLAISITIMGGHRPSALCQTQASCRYRWALFYLMTLSYQKRVCLHREALFLFGGVCSGSGNCSDGFQHHGQSCQALHSSPPPPSSPRLALRRQAARCATTAAPL